MGIANLALIVVIQVCMTAQGVGFLDFTITAINYGLITYKVATAGFTRGAVGTGDLP